jgi:hypothetical protein
MKLVSFIVASLGICCLVVLVHAHEVTTCKSPDEKFALRRVYSEQEPYTGDTAIIEVSTRKTILPLDSNWSIEGTAEHPQLQNGELKLLWSPDSQRVAYFAQNGNDLATRVFFRSGSSFNEIKLPELPSPKLFVDIFVTRFGIAQVKLAVAGSRVLQQPRCRPVFKLISWQQ